MTRAELQAFLNRDWGLFEALRDDELRRLHAQRGWRALLQQLDQLRDAARLFSPSWPTEAQRAEDLATHEAIALALATFNGRRRRGRSSRGVTPP